MWLQRMIVAMVTASVLEVKCENEYRSLLERLFLNYDVDVLPVKNYTNGVEVGFELYPVILTDVDEVLQVVTSSVVLQLIWRDEYLVWNTSEYNGLEYIAVSARRLWLPDIALAIYAGETVEWVTDNMKVRVKHDGTVEWNPMRELRIPCKMTTSKFPFDSHTCMYYFAIASQLDKESIFVVTRNGVNMSYISDNNEWNITHANCMLETNPVNGRSYAIVTIQLARKATFSVVVYVLPVMVVSIVNVFVFKLPVESGEKASFSLTVLLTFMLFFGTITKELPQSSDEVPFVTVLMLVLVLNSSVIIVLTILVIRISQKEDHGNIPTWLRTICTCVTGRRANGIDEEGTAISRKQGGEDNSLPPRAHKIDWKTIANWIDNLLFFSYVVILGTTWLAFYLVVRP